jgi:thioester reductase-like protein
MTCMLITGATGAVGSSLVPLCLQDDTTQVKLLLRSDSPNELAERVQGLVSFWRFHENDRHRLARIEALAGDVRLPRWGLGQADYERLAGQATHIIHAAGNVRLNQPLDEARRTAVDSVYHAVEFMHECQRRGPFRKLEVVSTVGVAGKSPGRILEQPYRPAAFHNTYEQAKSEAEHVLLGQIRGGQPITIHRPSMVVGDSRTGKILHFQVFYHLGDFLSGLRTEGVLPDTANVKLDIIPADYVAQAIYLASTRQETAGRIFHLCSGPERSWTLTRYTQRLREMLALRGQPLPALQRMSLADFRNWCAQAVERASPGTQRFLKALPYLLDYLQEEQLFDNSQSDRWLSAAGLPLPDPDQYLQQVMNVYWSRS